MGVHDRVRMSWAHDVGRVMEGHGERTYDGVHDRVRMSWRMSGA